MGDRPGDKGRGNNKKGGKGKGKDGGNFPNIFSLFPPRNFYLRANPPRLLPISPPSPEPAPDAKKKAKPPGF